MDDSGPTASIIIFVVLLLIDVFFYGFGAALNSLNEKEVERRANEEKDKKSQRLLKLLGNSAESVNTVQLITTLVNVIIGAVHLGILLHSVAGWVRYVAENGLKLEGVDTWIVMTIAAILSTVLLLYITLTLGVLLPKKIAARIPEKWAYLCVTPVYVVTRIFGWFTGLVTITTRGILRIFGINDRDDEGDVTEEEIISMVNEGHEQGVIEASEAEMISNIFEMGDKCAFDIMTHRRTMLALDAEITLREAVTFMLDEQYSRYPVYEEDVDHIIGILNLKDAMQMFVSGKQPEVPLKDLPGLIRECSFVPRSKKIDQLFREMQADKQQMVVVVDEYGQTDGIIAMEDILEEIVGNILDEYDDESGYIEEKGEDEYIIEGMTPLEELEERFGILFEEEESDTINGFLISRLEKIPEPDEEFDVDYRGYNFKILSVEDKMIQSVLVRKLPEVAGEMEVEVE